MIADSARRSSARHQLRRLLVREWHRGAARQLAAGWLWDRDGSSATFIAGAVVAGAALAMLSLLQEERRAA